MATITKTCFNEFYSCFYRMAKANRPDASHEDLHKITMRVIQCADKIEAAATSREDLQLKITMLRNQLDGQANAEIDYILTSTLNEYCNVCTIQNDQLDQDIQNRVKILSNLSYKTIERVEAMNAESCLVCGSKNFIISALPLKLYLKCCSVCKDALYCSRKCQKSDWTRHKVECITKKKS